jgi:hypothetical protein
MTLTETMKDDHMIHSTNHKFALMQIWNKFKRFETQNINFWILHPVACIIRIFGNAVPATISVVVRFYYFLLPLHVLEKEFYTIVKNNIDKMHWNNMTQQETGDCLQ